MELLYVFVSLFYFLVACLFFSPIHHLSCYIPFPSYVWSPILAFLLAIPCHPLLQTWEKISKLQILQVVEKVYTNLPWICVSSVPERVEVFPGLGQFAGRDTVMSNKSCAGTKSFPGGMQPFGSLWWKKWTHGLVTRREATRSRHGGKGRTSCESSILFWALK